MKNKKQRNEVYKQALVLLKQETAPYSICDNLSNR